MASNSNSASNTPQAIDDVFSLDQNTRSTEDGASRSGNNLTLDVMANDRGGNGKTLFSLDDGRWNGTGVFDTDLDQQDAVGTWETTANGNRIAVVNGKVQMDISRYLASICVGRRRLARTGGAVALALAGILATSPAVWAQWPLYGTGGSFFVPITTSSAPSGGPPTMFVSLTLNGGNSQPNNFVLDTGSMGLVASPGYYTAGNDTLLAPHATITYSTSHDTPVGALYLTNVQINGTNGSYVTARVPILAASNTGFHQLGVGFDRGGIMIGPNSSDLTPANNSYNMNPFLALVSSSNTALNVSTMQPGYIIGVNGFQSLGLGPGVLLGLNSQNTGQNTGGTPFAFQQLASAGGPPQNCRTAGMNCPLQWSAQNGTITITTGGQTYNLGSASQLPDSGISYMIVNAPDNNVPKSVLPLTSGTVSVYLPGQTTQPAYRFIVGDASNPSTPYEVKVTKDAPPSNLGRTFFENLTYLYDPINGFVGYQAAGTNGTNATIVPMLALQGTLAPPNGFSSEFPTFLMRDLTVQQSGSGAMNGPIMGPGGLTLQSGSLTLGGTNSYIGGTVVNGGTLTIGSTGSITGLLTVNADGTLVNNGMVNSQGQWQLNQGTFSNNGTFIANLANTGVVNNSGTITGSVINGTAGKFVDNGTVNGDVANMGVWTGNSTINGNLSSGGLLIPGNSIGTITVTGNLAHVPGGSHVMEVNAQGQSDKILVGGAATLQGAKLITVPMSGIYAPRTTYTLVSAAGGLGGTYTSAVSESAFLQPSLSYDANSAYLTMTIGGFAAAAQTPTQYAVGAALDAGAPSASGDFATVLGTIASLNSGQVMPFLTSISGQNYSAFSNSMVQGAQLFMNNFALQVGGGSVGPKGGRVALAEACDVACQTFTPPTWGAWGGALGGTGTVGTGTSAGATTYNVGGFAAGLDRLITPNFLAGVTVGYTTGTQWVSGFSGQSSSNTVQVGLYASFFQDAFYLDGMASYAYSTNQMWRNIAIPNLQQRTAQGLTGANQFFGQVEGGYRFTVSGPAMAFITPFARLQGYTGTQNAFTETGAQSLSLSVAAQTTNSLRSVIGAQLGGSMDFGWRDRLYAQLRLGWSHEYADVTRPVTASLAGAPSFLFTTYGATPTRDGAVVGVQATTSIAEAASIYLRYEGNIAGQDTTHALTAGLRMIW